MVFTGIWERTFVVSEFSFGSYCNRNTNSGTETHATKLILYGNL